MLESQLDLNFCYAIGILPSELQGEKMATGVLLGPSPISLKALMSHTYDDVGDAHVEYCTRDMEYCSCEGIFDMPR